MRKLNFLIALFLSVAVAAQESTVVDQLREYKFSADLLAKSIGGAGVDADHSFDIRMTSDIGSELVVEEAKYDPTKKQGERWILLSYNGKDPSKEEIREFNQVHNKKEDDIQAKIEDSSWDVKTDNKDYLLASFKYDRSTLHWRYKYLADIKGIAHFNNNTKHLEKVEYINERPTKITPFKVTDFHMVVSFRYNEREKIYQVEKEEINMDAKMFGKTVPVKEVYVYSNYGKK